MNFKEKLKCIIIKFNKLYLFCLIMFKVYHNCVNCNNQIVRSVAKSRVYRSIVQRAESGDGVIKIGWDPYWILSGKKSWG